MYVSEIIGEEYKQWTPARRVFISAPTGSGKTTFILDVLYPYAIGQGKRILYLINRKVLREQIEKQVQEIAYMKLKNSNAMSYITIMTYQTLEELAKRNPGAEVLHGYSYIICDEAHYFLKDSLFNTSTDVSYNFVDWYRGKAVLVFISATIDKIKDTIHDNNKVAIDYSTQYREKSVNESDFWYKGEPQYNYLDISIFGKIADIPNIVTNTQNKGKWFIFINDITEGKNIENSLRKQDVDAIFIDARYDSDEEKSHAVVYLVKEQIMKHKVIISTSVLDNGISVNDSELRNMIVLAESEEDLIQMLGRKRYDGKRVNLYLCLQSLEDFNRRLHYLEQILDVHAEYENYAKKAPNMISERLLQSPYFYQRARKFLCAYVGVKNVGMMIQSDFYCNWLSIRELMYQISFYRNAIEKFKTEGSYAFFKMQIGWLGLEDRLEEIIAENYEAEMEKHRKIVEGVLDGYLDRELDGEENKKIKIEIMESLRRLLELCVAKNEDREVLDADIRKKDRVLSANKFNECMESIGLEYRMTGGNKRSYFINKI